MDYFSQYYQEELKDQAYRSEWEAMTDIRSWVDLSLSLIYHGRNAAAERLDLRGIVITPQEFEQALADFVIARRIPQGEPQLYDTQIRTGMQKAGDHIRSRRERCREEGHLPRVFQVVLNTCLNPLEEFCFYLALVCEYDRKYERLYGYLQDNVTARFPTVGLGISLYRKMLDPSEDKTETDLWLGRESPLWQHLLKDIPPDDKESSLSRPMCVREDITAFIQGTVGSGKEWKPEPEPAAGAVLVRPVYDWEDLILDEEQLNMLHRICDRVHYRRLVTEQWGFGKKSPYGNGVSAIFYGSPGTGKTMAAQIIGRELKKTVWKVDLSRLVSKYIGETEKSLKRLFDAAAKQDVMLFFDEADTLFAKRSEVSGSNDRYANMETGYLLQQFEEFDGIAIMATNYINNIDEAFRRRIKFYVRFPFPDKQRREMLWNRMLPKEAPVEEPLCFRDYAARHECSGSDIKEVITNAAYLAAAAGHGIRNEDIGQALQIHYKKSGKKMMI